MFDTADIAVAAPPQPALPAQAGVVTRLLPVAMAGATVVMMAVAFYTRSGIARSPVFVAFPLMMLISAVVSAIAGRDRWRADLDGDRADYLDYLSDLRSTVVKTAAAQRVSLYWQLPEPDALWTLVGGTRMWERRAADPDFCCVRIGIGAQPLATRLVPPQLPAGNRSDPVTVTALRRFLQVHQTIRDVPIVLDLRGIGTATIAGDETDARGLLRAMICQLAVMHSPSRLLLVGAIDDRERVYWDWLKWLPHHQHPRAADDVGSARMVYPTLGMAKTTVADLLRDHPAPPHVVIIVDAGGILGLTGVSAGTDVLAGARLRVSAGQLTIGDDVIARPDRMDAAAALACARRLAAYHAADAGASPGDTPPWQQLLGIDGLAAFTPTALWDSGSRRDRLRVPIGTAADGAPLALDIKEAAEDGMGPHGLCVGATGSGKSELLRTIALGMMVRHSPEVLNLVLVDFKGGATFLGLEKCPHVAAVITNLSDEAPLVARMREALTGEMNRRQELLRAAGNLDNISAYQHTGARLPTLFIIVDEFSELLSQHPDFAEVFVAIGRLGRSLGMHLLLASQRLDEGRLRGLESHLSYRICLKTLSANESRIVLGTSDAYELPNTPGAGYLRAATGEPIPFRGAYVSGPCPITARPMPHFSKAAQVRRFTAVPVGRVSPLPQTSDANGQRTVLQTVVDRLSGFGPRAHEVWLPPLGASPELDVVLRDFAATGVLTVPIGIVDRPFEQRRTPLTVELAGAAGNVGVIGAPQSGKSTALCTLITALAATHDPSRVQFYCLDFGGGTLTSLCCLPHVGVVAGRAEPDLVGRTIAELESLLTARATGRRGDRFGDDVFLVADGWAALPTDHQGQITALAAQGLSFGVHVVVSASRWAELRPALKDQIGTRIELRLGDPADSELDRRRAQQVPEGRPGRGLSRDGQHMVIALPRTQICRRGTTTAPRIPLLPTRVDLTGSELSDRIVLGLEERQLDLATVDFDRDGHLLIFGDIECGKTATLRTLCHEIVRTASAAQAKLFVVDFRRTLLGVVESDHFGGYAASPAALGALLPTLLDMLRCRMPPAHVTQAQLRSRSWWSGPDIYLVVDDYEVVASNALAPILEYLPHARDLGLHLVVARRSGGAARALFDPLLAELRDSGCMGLMMSASPDDGPLIGSVRPVPLPPGRGMLVTRAGGHQLVQVAWSPPP